MKDSLIISANHSFIWSSVFFRGTMFATEFADIFFNFVERIQRIFSYLFIVSSLPFNYSKISNFLLTYS
jgi:hypothetical protein